MAKTLSHARIAAATAAALTSSFFFSKPVLAEKCSYSVMARKAPDNEAKTKDGPGSVTFSVQAGKGDKSLAITVPGGFMDGMKSGKEVAAALVANAAVAIDAYLGGKTSSQWECLTEPAPAPTAQPYTTAVPKPAAADTSGWVVPGQAKPPAPQPAATPPAKAAKPTEEEEQAERAAFIQLGQVQTILTSHAGSEKTAKRLLVRGNISDKKLGEARAAVQERENGVLLAMSEAAHDFMVLPAYRYWKAAHDTLANGTGSKDELRRANDNLDAADKALGPDKLERYPRNYSSDQEMQSALHDIKTTRDERDKRDRDSKRNAEVIQLKQYIETVYGDYPQDEQSKADKAALLKEAEAGNIAKARTKAEKRVMVAQKKSYTPGGKGAEIADEAALASEVSVLSVRTVNRDYDLQFHCQVKVQIAVDAGGRATKVTLLKGPAGYLGHPDFPQKLSDAIGRLSHGTEMRNKTYTKQFWFF